jgi:serine/threonine protein kinase
MRVIVDAIRYCHEMNVVHRDIKVSKQYIVALESFA